MLMPVLVLIVGTTQAILRAHYASEVGTSRSGEALGYYAVAQKSASVFSPLLVGTVSMLTGSMRFAFLVLAAVVALGFVVVGTLPPARFDEAAR